MSFKPYFDFFNWLYDDLKKTFNFSRESSFVTVRVGINSIQRAWLFRSVKFYLKWLEVEKISIMKEGIIQIVSVLIFLIKIYPILKKEELFHWENCFWLITDK